MNVTMRPQTPLLDLDLLKTLVAIAETGNFSAAAGVVFRSPSAVSMQIKRLEELLGRPVFVRDSRSVKLTDDGEALLMHARRVLALNQQILSQFIEPDISGTVRLGATDYATEQFLPATLRRFSQTHPGVSVDVVVDHSTYLEQGIERGELDIALVTRCCELKKDRVGEFLRREKLVWAGLKGGVAAEKTPLPVSVWEDGCIWRRAALDGLADMGRDFRITFKCSYISAQKAGILADLAIAPLPLSSCDDKVVALGQEYDLPTLPDFAIGMLIAQKPSAPIEAVANHFRTIFADKTS